MSLLVVGSVALDSIETPFGSVDDALGGSATFFSAAASLYCGVQLVGVVGSDFPLDELDFLERARRRPAGPGAARGRELPLGRRRTATT
jgi:bifunctional ADP-heptose synthase (sugar kinase/adenylyltransferase)